MARHELSEACLKRIEARVTEELSKDRFHTYHDSVGVLRRAMEPEDFARPRRAFEAIVTTWIREGTLPYLTAGVFTSIYTRHEDYRETGRDLLACIRELGRLGKE